MPRKSYQQQLEENERARREYYDNLEQPGNLRECKQYPCCLNCTSFQYMGYEESMGICERDYSHNYSIYECVSRICDFWESKDHIQAYPSLADLREKVLKMVKFLEENGEL